MGIQLFSLKCSLPVRRSSYPSSLSFRGICLGSELIVIVIAKFADCRVLLLVGSIRHSTQLRLKTHSLLLKHIICLIEIKIKIGGN